MLLPERVVVPVAVTVKPLPRVVPLTIAPLTPMFAVPAKVTVTGVALAERVSPPISKVFPAPLAVIVLPVEELVMFTAPIVNLVPVPAKVTPLLVLAVTVPAPRLRLLEEVLPAVPKVKSPPQVTVLFAALAMAPPLVLLIVPDVRVTAPEPRALLLLMFNVPAVRVTPPDAAELFPLKVKVPPAAFIVVSPVYVLLPERVVVPVAVTVKPLPGVVPLTIAPVTPMFAVPAKVTVVAVGLAERVNPPISRVLPTPLAVIDLEAAVLVIFTAPIVNLVPVPAKAIVLVELAVTTPVPRLRLFAAVFVDDPKASPSLQAQA